MAADTPSDKSVLRIESTTEQKAAMFEWLREKALTGLKGNHLAAIAMQELNDYAELRRSNILIGEETIARLRAGEIVRFDSLPITIAMVQDELGSAPSSTNTTDPFSKVCILIEAINDDRYGKPLIAALHLCNDLADALSAQSATRDSIQVADIERQIEHIKQNGVSLAKFGGDSVDEGRCRELCAMYLGEFIQNYRMGERLKALDLSLPPERKSP